jgi:Predicted nucleotide-binding protein containing TIR-like domain
MVGFSIGMWGRGGWKVDPIESLMQEARQSDFGIFVFAPDDKVDIRGQVLTVPRDNVIYELGLFSGTLDPKRCFFLVPMGMRIHMPSDLAGLTAGRYDAKRTDGNWDSAVDSFCSTVKQKKSDRALFRQSRENYLTILATQYECCNWITDEWERVSKKNQCWEKIVEEIRKFDHPAKFVLLKEARLGFYVAFAAAVIIWPMKQMLISLSIIWTQRRWRRDMRNTKWSSDHLKDEQKHRLADCASRMPNITPEIRERISIFRP